MDTQEQARIRAQKQAQRQAGLAARRAMEPAARQAADAYVAGPGAPEDAALRERVRALFERGTAMN